MNGANRFDPRIPGLLVFLYIFSAAAFSPLFAGDFSASTIKSDTDVAVMQVTGSFDMDTSEARNAQNIVTREFYQTHSDKYDFLIILTGFDFKMPAIVIDGETETARGFYTPVRNDIQGIGNDIFDLSSQYGSNKKLQGIIDIGCLCEKTTDPLDPKFSDTMELLSHELLHRWSARVNFKNTDGSISDALLGYRSEGGERAHWSSLLDTDGSVLYGNDWNDNGDGSFTSMTAWKYYSPLDLYLMGVIGKADVPPMLLIENSSLSREKPPETGVTTQGTARYVTINDIVAAEGERFPGYQLSQKQFKIGVILLVRPDTFEESQLYEVRTNINQWVIWFSALTDGRATIKFGGSEETDLPENPGTAVTPVDPRSVPSEIGEGVSWLMTFQESLGNWADAEGAGERDTREAIRALLHFTGTSENISKAAVWLESSSLSSLDYLSGKMAALYLSGREISSLTSDIIGRQNSDGGWGSASFFKSNPLDTSLVLRGLSTVGYSDKTVLEPALRRLIEAQNGDGGWGLDDGVSSVQTTISVLSALGKFTTVLESSIQIQKGLTWLINSQNTDGGFGSESSTVYDTAEALIVLKQLGDQFDVIEQALSYITGSQSKDGSWHDSPYQTALAVSAMWATMQETDLYVSTGDVTVSPETVTQLPTDIMVKATVRNLGLSGVDKVTVALYDGAVADGKKVSEQIIAINGNSSVEVVFHTTITNGEPHQLYVVVDPEGLISEAGNANNTALKILYVHGTRDFEIKDSDVTVTPSTANLLSPVVISATIRNNGTSSATAVPVKFSVEEDGEVHLISMVNLNIPAGGSVTREVAWSANRSGDDLVISVQADPAGYMTELDETNNKASYPVIVNASNKPNLTLSYQDITFSKNPAYENGNVDISAVIQNNGAATAENFDVLFYDGAPDIGGTLIGTRTVTALGAGESVTVVNHWGRIITSGESIIYIRIDSKNQVDEIDETDNDNFESLTILGLPDLLVMSSSISFTPQAPKEGDPVTINVTVQNAGEQEATNVLVKVSESGNTVSSGVVPSIPGNSNADISFTYDTTRKSGVYTLNAAIDPENEITEKEESNNTADRMLGIQDSSLWISERYLSPNGDGVKDDTQFFFTLPDVQTIHVEIADENGDVVRSFSGSEYENIMNGMVTWNGMNEKGMVVPDGDYRLNVLDKKGTLLTSLVATVDNNRSLLYEAIGTKYWLKTGPLKLLDEWEWLPDDSGIISYLGPDRSTTEYPNGIYIISPYGDDIQRIVPEEWSAGNDPVYDYLYHSNRYQCSGDESAFKVSPDGRYVAFILDKYNRGSGKTEQNRLWVIDRYDETKTLIDSYEFVSGNYWEVIGIFWSPDSTKLAYKLYNEDSGQYKIIIRNVEDTGRIVVLPEWGADTGKRQSLNWSPDSTRLAYASETDIVLLRVDGNSETVLEVNSPYNLMDWFDGEKLLVREQASSSSRFDIWIVDVGGLTSPKLVAREVRDISLFAGVDQPPCENGVSGWDISPNGGWFTYAVDVDPPNAPGTPFYNNWEVIKICDKNGVSHNAHQIGLYGQVYWSPDDKKLIIGEAYMTPHLGIHDTSTRKTIFWSSSYLDNNASPYELPDYYVGMGSEMPISFPWGFGNNSLTGGYWMDSQSILAIGAENSEFGVFNVDSYEFAPLPVEVTSGMLSPGGNFLAYIPSHNSVSEDDVWVLTHLLNLPAYLKISKQNTFLSIMGIAADRNFSQYKLEYADDETPDEWHLIRPPSDTPILSKNEPIARWTPPHEGVFYVRLTVTDKAGNTTWTRKRVTWGESDAVIVTNLYPTNDLFSPNEDGLKDNFSLNYSVVKPVHPEFRIYDEDGALIGKIAKDHSAPGDYSISWDARDTNGKIVPDGVYNIVINEYSFYFEVDNTIPEAELTFTQVEPEADKLRVYLNAYAKDSNFKSWRIIYGEGESPIEWFEYKSGVNTLGKSAPEKSPESVGIFSEEEIHFLEGKTFRLIVEDEAGNEKVVESAFSDDILVLNKWKNPNTNSWWSLILTRNGADFTCAEKLSELYVAPGIHEMIVTETYRTVFTDIMLQYKFNGCDDFTWHDCPVEAVSRNGTITLEWDNAWLDEEEKEVSSVRIKAIDESGEVYYSNEVLFNTRDDKPACAMSIEPDCEPEYPFRMPYALNPYDNLSTLKVGYYKYAENASSNETNYVYFKEYNVRKGDSIPVGHFALPLPSNLESGTYGFKLIGTDMSGVEHVAVTDTVKRFKYPPIPCYELAIAYHYVEGNAEHYLSSGIAEIHIDAGIPEDIPLSSYRTLNCYIEGPDGRRLLATQNVIDNNSLRKIRIDTKDIAEGDYKVDLILTYAAGGSTYEILSGKCNFVVDRSIPEATITFPSDFSHICPDKYAYKDGGQFFGITVTGSLHDINDIERYELFWGSKDDPQNLTAVHSSESHGWRLIDAPYLDVEYLEAASFYNVLEPVPSSVIGTHPIPISQGRHYLTLKVVDIAGNINMVTTSFEIAFPGIFISATDKVFSPNDDHVKDGFSFNYSLLTPATVSIKILRGTTVVRTLLSNESHQAGQQFITWDGRNASGAVVEDGEYTIIGTVSDSCGNLSEDKFTVEVDNTPPTALITYPTSGEPISRNVLEIKGTAMDLHPDGYVLEADEGGGSGSTPIFTRTKYNYENEILGEWNTTGKSGTWFIKLRLTDTAGNESEVVTRIVFSDRKTLIGGLNALPKYFSPNSDGKSDATTIHYEILEASDVKVDILTADDLSIKSVMEQSVIPGTHAFVWTGEDDTGNIAPDGVYRCRITATLPGNPSGKQEEMVTIYLDTAPPGITIDKPSALCLTDVLEVKGSIHDTYLDQYVVSLTGDSGTNEIDSGTMGRSNYLFGEMEDPAEGDYTLSVMAVDKAQNVTTTVTPFKIDGTPPEISIHAPVDQDFYGSEKNVVSVNGAIAETNLDTWSVRFGAGDNPPKYTNLIVGTDSPRQETLFMWPVGKDSGLADGRYTVSVSAKDCSGLEDEEKRRITIDNSIPVVDITAPKDGGYVKAPFEITGSVADLSLEGYTLELAMSGSNPKWSTIKTSTSTVQSSVLAFLKILPEDGNYYLKLTALDKVGNKNQRQVSFKIDTTQPSAPNLSGEAQTAGGFTLSWTPNTETDLAGYDLYRDGLKINTEHLTATTFVDPGPLGEGKHTYIVKAVDHAGWESVSSNAVVYDKDQSAPEAKIVYPHGATPLSEYVDVKGTAYSLEDFKEYRLLAGRLDGAQEPSAWALIKKSSVPIKNGTLSRWDLLGLAEGDYALKLEAEDLNGNIDTDRVVVRVDSTSPAAPVLISATLVANKVTLLWQAGNESDLAGYLVYRNHHLVNSGAEYDLNVDQYLISGTTYLDPDVPDGEFTYYIEAMDTAGNISGMSNTLKVSIDTRAPRANIVFPVNGYRFDKEFTITAEASDEDIVALQFQYKEKEASAWINLGPAVPSRPFITKFDPEELGLAYGTYLLRAIATDAAGKTDPSPSQITIYYKDSTGPTVPSEFKAVAVGGDVSFSWAPNPETDLAGYNLYRVVGESNTKLNTVLITGTVYALASLSDAAYTFELTAVDREGNESNASDSVNINIFTPKLVQPYTPSVKGTISLDGIVLSGSSVELFKTIDTAPRSVGTVIADPRGNFMFNTTLSEGENIFIAKATDQDGTVSKPSDPIMVVYNSPPASPTGFTAGNSTTLVWEPNTEPDLFGYNVYRNGERMNMPSNVAAGIFTSSSWDPSRAFDSNENSYVNLSESGWWAIELSTYSLITQVGVSWYGSPAEQFQIQVWTGYVWLTLFEVERNTSWSNTFDFDMPYGARKLRVVVTKLPSDVMYAKLAEVTIQKENVIFEPRYNPGWALDGNQFYQVSAVDRYGLESPFAQEAAPAPPSGLAAGVTGDDVVLSWDAISVAGIAGFNIFEVSGGHAIKLNASVVGASEFRIKDVILGTHLYRLTVVTLTGAESVPCDPISATVVPDPAQETVSLSVTVIPKGESLEICWESMHGDVSGYNLYRKESESGAYQKINGDPMTSTCFTDQALINGKTYSYLVAAVDSVGNQDVCSVDTAGTPNDTSIPAPPRFTSPTVAGYPIEVGATPVGISGIAEPGSSVSLYKGGTILSSIDTKEGYVSPVAELNQNGWGFTFSPDGKSLAYVYWDSAINTYAVRLQDITSGTVRKILENADSPKWSPDGTMLLFTGYSSGNSLTGIYELISDEFYTLNDGSEYSEYDPSWSPSSRSIVYASRADGAHQDIWRYELNTGLSVKLTEEVDANAPKISASGKHVVFVGDAGLKHLDIASGEISLIDATVFENSAFKWSPVADKLVFLSFRNGFGELYLIDMETGTTTLLTHDEGSITEFCWSSNGSHILASDQKEGYIDVWMVYLDGETEGTLLYRQQDYFYGVFSTDTGGIFALSDNTLISIIPDGNFTFETIPLSIGKNRFSAKVTDSSGNKSDPSDAIDITLSSDLMADLAITDRDISFFPAAPISGDNVIITLCVKNTGAVDLDHIAVDVSTRGASGVVKPINTETIQHLSSHSEETVSLSWSTTGKTGKYSIIAEVRPESGIKEANDNNNKVIRDLFISQTEGLEMDAAIGSNQYGPMETLHAGVEIYNSGSEQPAHVDLRIVDENNALVTNLAAEDITPAYGAVTKFDYTWDTGATYSGNYAVQVTLSDSSGPVESKHLPFLIAPDVNLASVLTTGKSNYGANEEVWVTLGLTNAGINYDIPAFSLNIRITDGDGILYLNTDIPVAGLPAGDSVRLEETWNTGRSPAGLYHVTATLSLGGDVSVERTRTFAVAASDFLSGKVSVSPAVTAPGEEIRVSYSVKNGGNAALSGVQASVSILDLDSLTVMDSEERSISLAQDETHSEEIVFPTTGLSLKTYRIVLQYEKSGKTETLAAANFTVRDILGPVVIVSSPENGAVYGDKVSLSVTASDNASGIARVEHRIDQREWVILPVVDASTGKYAALWTPTEADAGTHTVSFRAYDGAGNVSAVASASVVVEFSSAFETLSAVTVFNPDSTYQGQSAKFSYTIANDHSGSINDLVVSAIITDPATGEVLRTLEETRAIAAKSNITGVFNISTLDIPPDVYAVALVVKTLSGKGPRSLSMNELEVKPALEVTPGTTRPINLLVWVNDNCPGYWGNNHRCGGRWHDFRFHCEERRADDDVGTGTDSPIRLNLIEEILEGAVSDYLIVQNRKDFMDALRNPYFTDILILGERHPVLDPFDRELIEKVHSGTGLISCLWLPNILKNEVLGVTHKGWLSSQYTTLRLADGDVTSEATLQTNGKARNITVMDGTTVAGWMRKDAGSKEYPAVVLNEFGLGKTVFCSFNLGLTLNDSNFDDFSEMLYNAIQHVHRTEEKTSCDPVQFVPSELFVKGVGAETNARITASFQAPLSLYDPAAGRWKIESPWAIDLKLGPAEEKSLFYYYLTPDTAGSYPVETDIEILADGDVSGFMHLDNTVTVQTDKQTLARQIIDKLNSYSLPPLKRLSVKTAVKLIENVSTRSSTTIVNTEKNIRDLSLAIAAVVEIGLPSDTAVRLEMDRLLGIEQGKYYFLSYPIEE